MDFSYPAESEQFRKELRAWLLGEPHRRGDGGRPRRGSDPSPSTHCGRWDAKVADAGWGAVAWPPEYGGRGATVLEQLAYAEETTRARAPVPLNVIGMNNIAPAIMQYGTEYQKPGLLPRMVRADDIWCQGMSEPEAGSDLASLRTRAVRWTATTLRRQRSEDLDLTRTPRRLVPAVRAHRPGCAPSTRASPASSST